MSTKGNVVLPISEARKIHFVVSARDLPMRDRGCLGATVQDPFVRWTHKNSVAPFQKPTDSSHRVNEPNPDWHDSVFEFDWVKGTGQLWHFEILDHDALSKDDPIAFVDVSVDSYVMQKHEELSVKLSSSQGMLLLKKCSPVHFKLAAKDLPKLDPLKGLSDPYVQCFWSPGPTGPQTLFATTKTVKNVENAKWDEVIQFPSYQIGTNQFWTFKVFDKDPLPKDDAIGQASVDVDRFVREKNIGIYNLSQDAKHLAQLIVTNIDTLN